MKSDPYAVAAKTMGRAVYMNPLSRVNGGGRILSTIRL